MKYLVNRVDISHQNVCERINKNTQNSYFSKNKDKQINRNLKIHNFDKITATEKFGRGLMPHVIRHKLMIIVCVSSIRPAVILGATTRWRYSTVGRGAQRATSLGHRRKKSGTMITMEQNVTQNTTSERLNTSRSAKERPHRKKKPPQYLQSIPSS